MTEPIQYNSEHRIEWIDSLKGLGILLIVIGHVWSVQDASTFYIWLFSFHVPLFFFAAGLTFKINQGSILSMVRKRSPNLLVPYFIFGLLGYVFYVTGYFFAKINNIYVEQFNYGLFKPLWGIAYGSIGDGLLVNSPIWFLPALLISSTIVYALNQTRANMWMRYTALIALFYFGSTIAEYIKLPFSSASAFCSALFIQIGIDLKSYILHYQYKKKLIFAAMLLLFTFSLLAPINGGVGLAGPTINNPIWFIAFSVAGTFCALAFVLFVKHNKMISKFLQLLGQHSMAILVLHMLAIKGVKVILSIITGVSVPVMEQHLEWGLLVLLVASALIVIPIVIFTRFTPWVFGSQRKIRQTSSLAP